MTGVGCLVGGVRQHLEDQVLDTAGNEYRSITTHVIEVLDINTLLPVVGGVGPSCGIGHPGILPSADDIECPDGLDA
ncbi:hypothetical protein [Agromyces sp. NPDC056965]|uniref:hypothetical protein n=1 Tax=Agromyces sp. NPDC056965 TaxID=3345983 RepID=UPI00363F729E